MISTQTRLCVDGAEVWMHHAARFTQLCHWHGNNSTETRQACNRDVTQVTKRHSEQQQPQRTCAAVELVLDRVLDLQFDVLWHVLRMSNVPAAAAKQAHARRVR